jgi:hypothetical protein
MRAGVNALYCQVLIAVTVTLLLASYGPAIFTKIRQTQIF